ncbi:MAG: hypothetical protein ACO1QB_02430 [Verrucomicrobiales bacterium]
MKRSTAVILVLSGAMFQACSEKPSPAPQANWGETGLTKENMLTNNTYVEGRGYYHAPYGMFFPMPFNSFVPGSGYYHGGRYSPQPNNSPVASSAPGRHYKPYAPAPGVNAASDPANRGGFTRSSSGSRGGLFSGGS